jgi:hypothetical protein
MPDKPSWTSLRISEIVAREKPRCSANFLKAIGWPERATGARTLGSGCIPNQRITSVFCLDNDDQHGFKLRLIMVNRFTTTSVPVYHIQRED